MKKFIFSILMMFLLVILLPFGVKAEENNSDNNNDNNQDEIVIDTTIIKFDYYPGGTLAKERELTFEWISTNKMENLLICLYNPNTYVYVDIFDINWDLNDEELEYDVEFEIINEPIDDPLTTDIDESKDKLWEYKLTFKIAKDTYGLLKFKFIYECNETTYENLFYLPNVVYPSVIVPPTPPTVDENNGSSSGDNNNDNDDNKGYFTTSNALIAAIFATLCSVIGTLLIIFSSQYRKIDDEELK